MSKPRRAGRFRGPLFTFAALAALAVVATCWWAVSPSPGGHRRAAPGGSAFAPTAQRPGVGLPLGAEHCDEGLADAARRNREGLEGLAFAPFLRPETGWAIYAPLIVQTVGGPCAADTPGFASRLAAWQSQHGLPASGVMDAGTFDVLKATWQGRRTFVAASGPGCPEPPPEASLSVVPLADSYGGKSLLLRPAALAAYERMLATARAEAPELAADHGLMTIFSAYRSPAADALRCLTEGNCQNIVRTTCSAHLTGLAVDLNLGAAAGYRPDSSDDANRRYIVRGAAYRWMAVNAGRFGFVPYPFEPWHWEWTGEPVRAPPPS